MFLATHLPAPLPPSTQTSLNVESPTPPSSSSPAVVSALDRLDTIIRSALGRSVHGVGSDGSSGTGPTSTGNLSGGGEAGSGPSGWWPRWTSDDAVAAATMAVVFLLVFLALLVVKLVLGAGLLRYSRDRYARMKKLEHAVASGAAEPESHDAQGKRVGGRGQVETGEERRRWIYADDPEGLGKLRDRERRAAGRGGGGGGKDLSSVIRYEMVAKRIW